MDNDLELINIKPQDFIRGYGFMDYNYKNNMRSIFAVAAVCGLVSAGNLYTYTGTSHIDLQDFLHPNDLPPVEPYGNFTNSTVFAENVYVEDKPVVKLKIDHGVDLGYSGSYKSEEVDDDELWHISYTLNAYGKITETFTLSIADFYNLKVQFVFDLFKMQVFKPVVTFVHPWAIWVAKNEDPSVTLPFDVKLKTEFKIDKLLDVTISATDNMRANFNKELDHLAKEMFSFAEAAIVGEEYIVPEDDTKNIADPANYIPSWNDFKTGG
jgi:hypothetical protein